jgi:hypothetical protein
MAAALVTILAAFVVLSKRAKLARGRPEISFSAGADRAALSGPRRNTKFC